jgi:hypothetical protein
VCRYDDIVLSTYTYLLYRVKPVTAQVEAGEHM